MNYVKFLLINALLCFFCLLPMKEDNNESSDISLAELAEQGHPEPMVLLLDQALQNDNYADVLKWMFRFKIRTFQDIACCNDPSAAAAMDAITIRQMSNKKFGKIDEYISKEDKRKIFLEQIDWVEQKLQANQLPNPNWVAKYSIGVFLRQKSDFLAQEECQRKRENILHEIKEQLKNSK